MPSFELAREPQTSPATAGPANRLIGSVQTRAVEFTARPRGISAVRVQPAAPPLKPSESVKGGGRNSPATKQLDSSVGNSRQETADYVLNRLAPCEPQRFQLMDYETVELFECKAALGNWGPGAIEMSQMATDDANRIHTLGLSMMNVMLMRAGMFDGTLRLKDSKMWLGSRPNRASAAGAVRRVASKLGNLSEATGTLWVRLPAMPNVDYMIGDSKLKLAVAAVLKRQTISVLALTNPTGPLNESFPHTWGHICTVLGSTSLVQTLEFHQPEALSVDRLLDWPFLELHGLLQHHLVAKRPQWSSIRRLSFTHFKPARLEAEHLLEPTSVRQLFAGESPLRELALYFNFPDLSDAIRAFLPLVSGFLDGATGQQLKQLLVHTVTHLTFLAMADVDIWSKRTIEPGAQCFHAYPVAVVHYLPSSSAITAAHCSEMLAHLRVVLPRVRAATLHLPRQLCEGEPCHVTHHDAAERLSTVLRKSQGLWRLKLDYGAKNQHREFAKVPTVPWYAQALADAGPLRELQMLSIRSHVSDKERGQHLVDIVRNNPRLDLLTLYLEDRIVFADNVSAPDSASPLGRNRQCPKDAGPVCVVRGISNGQVPPVLSTCLGMRYEPLISALRASQIRRILVRAHLTYHVPGEVVPELVRQSRRAAAATMARELAAILADTTQTDAAPKFHSSAIFWHRRLSKVFAIESNADRTFPALRMARDDQGSLSHAMIAGRPV